MNEEIECFVVERQMHDNKTSKKKSFYVSVYGEDVSCPSKLFSSLEELVLNLELKFPGIAIDCDVEQETVDKHWRGFRVHGIPEEVLRECLQKGEPLL